MEEAYVGWFAGHITFAELPSLRRQVSLISQTTWKNVPGHCTAEVYTEHPYLHYYEPISVLGQLEVEVKHRNYEGTQVRYVVSNGPPLLERNGFGTYSWTGPKPRGSVKVQSLVSGDGQVQRSLSNYS